MNFQARLSKSAVLAAALFIFSPVHAHDYSVGELRIEHPWARPTVAGQKAGGAFMKLSNPSKSGDRLVGVKSDVAESTELHSMTMDGNVMRMREVPAIDLPAGQVVELKPGAFHVMFMGLKAPLKVGDMVPLTLRFERAGEVAVQVKVESMPAAEPAAGHGKGAHAHH